MEILAKSKGGRVTDRLEEAGGNAVSRRTETSYKAERLGEAAQHVEALDSSRTVNDAVVQQQFTFLSARDLPHGAFLAVHRHASDFRRVCVLLGEGKRRRWQHRR